MVSLLRSWRTVRRSAGFGDADLVGSVVRSGQEPLDAEDLNSAPPISPPMMGATIGIQK